MNKKVLLHIGPTQLNTPDGNKCHSAKFYPIPFWQEIVKAFPDWEFTQIGVQGDFVISGVIPRFDLTEQEITKIAFESDFILTVDSFLPHLLAPSLIKCIVLWSKSDPLIYGYTHNINLLKDRKYLRHDQFTHWGVCPVDPNAFVGPEVVIKLLSQPASSLYSSSK